MTYLIDESKRRAALQAAQDNWNAHFPGGAPTKPRVLAEGVRVAYARGWLRSTGQTTGDMPFARGIVRGVKHDMSPRLHRVTVDWLTPTGRISSTSVALACNLVAEADLPFEPV